MTAQLTTPRLPNQKPPRLLWSTATPLILRFRSSLLSQPLSFKNSDLNRQIKFQKWETTRLRIKKKTWFSQTVSQTTLTAATTTTTQRARKVRVAQHHALLQTTIPPTRNLNAATTATKRNPTWWTRPTITRSTTLILCQKAPRASQIETPPWTKSLSSTLLEEPLSVTLK